VRDSIATVTLLNLIWGFTGFDFVYIMTNGGPGTASDVTSTFVYQQAFVNDEFGYACAAAVVTTIMVAGMSMIYLTLFKPRGIRKAG
jgi:ABC-type sugar transport system permease subunit